MRILYANVIERNAPWGAEVFVDQALATMGHTVINVDYREHRNALASQFLRVVDFDLFILQRGDYFPLRIVRAINRPKVFWFSELVVRRDDADHLFKADIFDRYYVRTPQCAEEIVKRGWVERNKIGIMLSAFGQEMHRPLAKSQSIEVLFIGSMTGRRAQWLDYLKRRFRVAIAQAFGEELVQMVNQAKIVLNIHASDYLDTETRVFEVLGCGAFLLTETLSGECPFRANIHYAVCDSAEAMAEQIDYYLRNESERQKIAQAGYAEAISKHTYAQRAEQIISDISQIPSRGGIPLRTSLLRYQHVIESRAYWARNIRRRLAALNQKCKRLL